MLAKEFLEVGKGHNCAFCTSWWTLCRPTAAFSLELKTRGQKWPLLSMPVNSNVMGINLITELMFIVKILLQSVKITKRL